MALLLGGDNLLQYLEDGPKVKMGMYLSDQQQWKTPRKSLSNILKQQFPFWSTPQGLQYPRLYPLLDIVYLLQDLHLLRALSIIKGVLGKCQHAQKNQAKEIHIYFFIFRTQVGKFSVKCLLVNIFGFVGNEVSVPTTQLYHCNMIAALDNKWTNKHSCVQIKLSLVETEMNSTSF